MKKKVCFVAMGFGKKMDFENVKEVDLDKIYKRVIKPLFEQSFIQYKLIRADEIAGSAIIDISMYALLLNADLVIADLTTLNPNALYELGVRHAVRPFSTIIMAQKNCKIPFDLNHSRFLTYDEIGEELHEDKVQVIQELLAKFVLESEKQMVDSPLYSFLPNTTPPVISETEYNKIIQDVENQTDTITKLIDKAKNYMKNSEFQKAIWNWKKLRKALPNNDYIVQQLALSTYKSELPNKTKALENALDIIKELNPEKSLDLETLGITGAIYKNLFRLNKNFDYLDEAIKFYKKGFIVKRDYYNGENYANCMLMKTEQETNSKEFIIYIKVEIEKVYTELISIINNSLNEEEINYWMYATLSVSHYYLGDNINYEKYRDMFYDKSQSECEKETFIKTIEEIKKLKN